MEKEAPRDRVRSTLHWIVQSFYELLGRRSYASIPVNEIARRAGVGRSTFYEHFRNKEELLQHSLTEVLSVLADTVTCGENIEPLERLMEHLWGVRNHVKQLTQGPTESLVFKSLALLIADRLDDACAIRGVALRIPRELAAAHLSGAQLALIRAWQSSDGRCTSKEIAHVLRETTVSAVESFLAS